MNDQFKTGEALSDYLLYNYNIFATPGSIFGSNGENYIRFSICASQSDLRKALIRIKTEKVWS